MFHFCGVMAFTEAYFVQGEEYFFIMQSVNYCKHITDTPLTFCSLFGLVLSISQKSI